MAGRGAGKGRGPLLRVDVADRSGDMDDAAPADLDKMIDHRPRAHGIVEADRGPAADLRPSVDEDGRRPARKGRGELLVIEVRRHDDQSVDSPAHCLEHGFGPTALRVHVGQEQEIAALGRQPVHPAHDLGEELAVEIGQDHADRPGSRQAEAAGAGVRHVAEIVDCGDDPLASFFTDVVDAIEYARHRCHGNLGTARNVADCRFCHDLPSPDCDHQTRDSD